MFAKPRQKKTLAPPPKKRKAVHAMEEISFDNDARADYLTGFHKRKQARIKQAQEFAAEQARKERIEMRKQLRDERKRDLEKHVEQVNALLRDAQRAGTGADSDDESDGAWEGFEDKPPALEPMNFEEEYIDEDKFTTVTIESVHIDRDGLHKPEESEDEMSDEDGGRSGDKNQEPKSSKDQRLKKKKKRFRYETQFERRLTARKQKSKRFGPA